MKKTRNVEDSAKEMKNEVCLRHMKVGATLCGRPFFVPASVGGTAQAVTEGVKLEFGLTPHPPRSSAPSPQGEGG